MELNFNINGKSVTFENIDPLRRLIDILREDLALLGTKEGCGEGECGACSVLRNGKAVNSCLVLACQIEGDDILTIEGLAREGEMDPLQRAFIEHGAVQCGYCSPGMIMAAKSLLLANPDPTETEIRTAISGNICRCSGYAQIVAAIQSVAADQSERKVE